MIGNSATSVAQMVSDDLGVFDEDDDQRRDGDDRRHLEQHRIGKQALSRSARLCTNMKATACRGRSPRRRPATSTRKRHQERAASARDHPMHEACADVARLGKADRPEPTPAGSRLPTRRRSTMPTATGAAMRTKVSDCSSGFTIDFRASGPGGRQRGLGEPGRQIAAIGGEFRAVAKSLTARLRLVDRHGAKMRPGLAAMTTIRVERNTAS